ncbi:Ribosomal protein S18 [Penicillium digitatum]|uniref:Small ribosomal subunit protein bS18m n=1 Tax=Penicillium digitatum TaxID=36651 RepID=A0A7T6XQR9_PENDI|nr:Ribosomal protein S18 [Penicillium digitatum]
MSLNLISTSSLLRNAATTANVGLSLCRWSSTAAMSAFTSQRGTSSQTSQVVQRRRLPSRLKFLEDQKAQGESRALERYQTRDFKAGDIYSPHDLSPAEMKKWGKRQSPQTDAFDALNLNPMDLYKSFSVMSEYMTSMGRIKPRAVTGLRPVNQRKIAKALRRAIGMGLMPSVHRHPEILASEMRARMEGPGGF